MSQLTRQTVEVLSPSPSTFSAQEFKTAFRYHPGGVALITGADARGPVALTATSVSSVSADPPLLVFSVSALSSSSPVLATVPTVVVHLLDASETGLALAKLGATSGIDRFADRSAWTELATGEPVFHGCCWLRARVVHRLNLGVSTLIVAQVVESNGLRHLPEQTPGLVYMDRTWHGLTASSRIQ